jgi:hypothetical protein
VISDLPIDGAGIEMMMHPTLAPVVVAAKSSLRLELCPIGFGLRRSGCLRLTERPRSLPATDGRTHVGFRIVPLDARAGTLDVLRVRWRCAD